MKSVSGRFIVGTILIVVGAMVALWFYTQHQNVLRTEMMYIGEDLVQTTNSARLVNIGPNLQDKLNELLASKTHVSKVLLGDEPIMGDGKATGRLILTNAKGAAIGVRLRRERLSKEKYHVLGFWTISGEDPSFSTNAVR